MRLTWCKYVLNVLFLLLELLFVRLKVLSWGELRQAIRVYYCARNGE